MRRTTGSTGSGRGRVWRGSSWSGPYLVATADLLRFSGGRDEVDADEFDVLLRYAGLNARAEARKRHGDTLVAVADNVKEIVG